MSKDLNDRMTDGTMPRSPDLKVVPLNEAAKRREEESPPRVHSVRDLLAGSAERAGNPKRLEVACTTGHWELDMYTGGLRPGFAWVVGADTSWGKSTWAVSVADENIRKGKRVMIVSVEDPPELYGDRLLSRRAQVSAMRIMKGQCTGDELRKIHRVRDAAEDVPVYVQCGMRPIEAFAKQLTSIIRGEGIDVVIFDYLQEFQTSKRHQDERTRFKWTSGIMRDVIRSNDKTGIILSQLTITGDKKIPDKHSIRESRDVSNAAEVVAIGFCPDEDVFKPSPGRDSNGRDLQPERLFEKGKKYLLLDKNKAGPPKKRIKLSWNEDLACFDQVEDPEQEWINQQARENDADIGVSDDDFD